jgi:hypothetical protein
MTEQDRFEAYANTQGYSVEKDDEGLYRSLETFCHWATWQAAIESRKPMTEDQIRQVISETSAIALFKHQDFVRAIERFHGIGG